MYDRIAELYDLFYDWKDYRGEATKLRQLIAERDPVARSLLDVACGTGSHLVYLRDWFAVEGVDASRAMLNVAAKRLPGAPLHQGDMRDFDLGRDFDVVTCLFSSIGYVETVEDLSRAVAAMARHVAASGVLILEPWLTPYAFDPRHLGRINLVERPNLQAVRMNTSRLEGNRSVMEFHYLIAHPGTVEHLTDTHSMGLFTDEEYQSAFEQAGMSTEHDADGLMGRGLWIGRRPQPA